MKKIKQRKQKKITIYICGSVGDFILHLAKVNNKFTFKEMQNNLHFHFYNGRYDLNNPKMQSIKKLFEHFKFTYTMHPREDDPQKLQKECDYYLSNPHFEASYDNINLRTRAFPEFPYSKIDADVVINPVGSRYHYGEQSAQHQMNIKQIKTLIDNNPNRKFHFIGWCPDKMAKELSQLERSISLMNKEDVIKFLDISMSANIFIGYIGLGVILASMARKKVYMLYKVSNEMIFVNPDWNIEQINSLNDIGQIGVSSPVRRGNGL